MDKRIASLDGFRAFSITLVILNHAFSHVSVPILWRLPYGAIGVRIFFVISGFLITALLLRELDQSGEISLYGFYARRVARILPASYFYVVVVAAMIPFGLALAHYEQLPSVLFYYADYHLASWTHGADLSVGQFWSLSVEEQFYLLWPAALLMLGKRRGAILCALLLLLAPAFRTLSLHGLWPTSPSFSFESQCDSIACGCLLAILREPLWRIRPYRMLIETPAPLALFVIGCALLCLGSGGKYAIGIPIMNFGIVAMLDRYMRFQRADVGRLLNWRPIMWIGTVSYSLYIWQGVWVFTTLPFVVRVIGSIACAAGSYYFVEQPARRWLNTHLGASRQFAPRVFQP
ncbi:MAG: acyltransferase family protein [Steroidobacteraceae bacterium]